MRAQDLDAGGRRDIQRRPRHRCDGTAHALPHAGLDLLLHAGRRPPGRLHRGHALCCRSVFPAPPPRPCWARLRVVVVVVVVVVLDKDAGGSSRARPKTCTRPSTTRSLACPTTARSIRATSTPRATPGSRAACWTPSLSATCCSTARPTAKPRASLRLATRRSLSASPLFHPRTLMRNRGAQKHNVFMMVHDAQVQEAVGKHDAVDVMARLREMKNVF